MEFRRTGKKLICRILFFWFRIYVPHIFFFAFISIDENGLKILKLFGFWWTMDGVFRHQIVSCCELILKRKCLLSDILQRLSDLEQPNVFGRGNNTSSKKVFSLWTLERGHIFLRRGVKSYGINSKNSKFVYRKN